MRIDPAVIGEIEEGEYLTWLLGIWNYLLRLSLLELHELDE